ncbi:MAG: ArsR family transcriptional regulator [Pseudohongiella sp.]|nr:MAG: ArsR family transcriptional regulator [Pseudohongiella sp.]
MAKIKLDRIDAQLLSIIQSDGKITNIELADKVGLSPSPCLRRTRALEASGVIKRYVGILDPKLIGLTINGFVTVRLKNQGRKALEEFESRIQTYKEVMECYLMTGTSDYLLRISVQDLAKYEQFLIDKVTTIPGVGNIESSFSLKQVVYRTEMPIIPHQ